MATIVRRRIPGLLEILYRGRQEAGKLLERAWSTDTSDETDVEFFSQVTASEPVTDPSTLQGGFFDGAIDPVTPALLRRNFPAAVADVVEHADRLLAGRFDLLGYRSLDFGEPLDWHLDVVSGIRAPRLHWSQLNPLDRATVGDSKVTWELSRQQWLVTLAIAYRFTGDDRYARRAEWAFRAWQAANPPGMGLNWASSLEAAMRLVSWCWVLTLLRDAPTMTARLRHEFVTAISRHAAFVAKYLSYYFSPNTHLTGEALGLFYAGVLLPPDRTTRRWRELGHHILVTQATRQIHPDGVYFEHATCYQRYTAEIYLQFLILASRNGIDVPAVVTERVVRLLDFLLAICRPGGEMPQIGDGDGGWLLPLMPRQQDDCRGVFGTAACLFDRADYAWSAGGLVPEALWLFGPDAISRLDRLTPAAPAVKPSRLFASGYVVMRESWQNDAHQLIFDVGPLGCHMSSGHGHADLLSIQVSPFGEPCIVDPGTGCYTADMAWRNYFRSPAAHSAVRLGGGDYVQPAGPFSWKGDKPRAQLRHWHSAKEWDFADAIHSGWTTPAGTVSHRRRVLYMKRGYWIVVDDLTGTGRHDVELRFQFWRTELELDGLAVRARTETNRGLWLIPLSTVRLDERVAFGAEDPAEGWYSPDYGQREPAPALVYSAAAALPLRLVTVLVPADGDMPRPSVAPVLDATGTIAGVRVADTGERVTLDEERRVTVARYASPPDSFRDDTGN